MAPKLIPAVNLLTLAEKHVGESYILGTIVPKDNPNWTGPWNCSEFASWLVYQTSQRLFGCEDDASNPATVEAYTGAWQRDALRLGTMVPLAQAIATPGAFLLRYPPAPGQVGHIVLSDGTGGTVEAHGHADGVIRGSVANRRWDTGVLVPWYRLASGAPVILGDTPAVLRLTSPLMTGPPVRALQKALTAARFDPGVQDGVFGPHTMSAVSAYQATKGLVIDGEAGPTTLAALGLAA